MKTEFDVIFRSGSSARVYYQDGSFYTSQGELIEKCDYSEDDDADAMFMLFCHYETMGKVEQIVSCASGEPVVYRCDFFC